MALKIDAEFEGKLTCASKNDLRNLANFHGNEPNKNSKQPDQPDAV